MADATRLDEQAAIVTGAAQGIGKAVALTLAEAGAAIVIGDIKDAKGTVSEIRSGGGKAVSMIMDTSSPADARALVELSLSEYGRLDILVNNAGIDAPRGNAWDLPEEEWDRTIAVNLSGVFYCSKAALEPMLKAGRGSIVNMSSQSAYVGLKGMSPAYNASKAGLLGLTMALSVQVAHQGIRVNAILPSLVASKAVEPPPEVRAVWEREIPLGPGTPKDIAEAIRYLVSPAARWVSGTLFDIHGGRPPGSWLEPLMDRAQGSTVSLPRDELATN